VKDDPLREDLLTELRALRRGAGPFGQDRVALSEMLIDFVGRGSIEQAYTTLLDVLDRSAKTQINTPVHHEPRGAGKECLRWQI